jgi:glycolate oxidase
VHAAAPAPSRDPRPDAPGAGGDSGARRQEVARALAGLLPPDCLLSREEELRPYECDGLAAYRQQPLLVALPRTEEQVCAVARACDALGVPLVARGAGTGLSGGALPHAGGVLLSLARLDRILGIDPVARTARVQPGVRNLTVSEAAAPFGLYYAPDPSSQLACTIGGNVAENSGGVHCLKYGLTVHNVLAVRGCTVAGEIIELGGGALDGPGLDLLAITLGSEGLLLVVTEVLLKLIPKPERAQVVMASFDDVGKAGDGVAAIIAAGIIPAGLEMMDRQATAAVEPFVKAGYDLSAAAILLAESDGTADEVAEEVAALSPCCAPPAPRRSRYRARRPSGCASGREERTPFPPPGGSHPITTAWTAPFPARPSARCCGPSRRWNASTA